MLRPKLTTHLQKVVPPKILVVPPLGLGPKATCKVSRVVPLYNMVNLQHDHPAVTRTLISER